MPVCVERWIAWARTQTCCPPAQDVLANYCLLSSTHFLGRTCLELLKKSQDNGMKAFFELSSSSPSAGVAPNPGTPPAVSSVLACYTVLHLGTSFYGCACLTACYIHSLSWKHRIGSRSAFSKRTGCQECKIISIQGNLHKPANCHVGRPKKGARYRNSKSISSHCNIAML